MKYPKNEKGMYVLSIWDQEDLHYVAEDVITGLRFNRCHFDGEGNYIALELSKEERLARIDKMDENAKTDYLNFRENEELRQLSFSAALDMPLEKIKKKYLKDVLPMARGILQKDTMDFGHRFVVSEEVSDSFLNDLLALRWRENLKLWTIHWWDEERENREKEEADDCSDR